MFVVLADAVEEGPFQVDTRGVELADQPSGVHQQHPVRNPRHLVQVVATDQDRGAVRGTTKELLAQQNHRGRVESIAGLVQHNQPRVVLQRGRQPGALPVSERQPTEPALCERAELPHLKSLVDPPRIAAVQPASDRRLSRTVNSG